MSRDLLGFLADRVAFDSTPSFGDLGVYHVPFDALVGGEAVEGRLGTSVRRGERAVLLADSGAGKSSLVSHVLGPLAEGVAPLVVPVHALEQEATRPAMVADELLAMVLRYRQRLESVEPGAMVAGSSRQVTHSKRYSGGVGLAFPWLRGELAADIVRQVQVDERISLAAKTDVLASMFERIARDELQPVVIFDDTDRWLSETDEATVRGFFTEAMRWLAELPVSVVVAAHHGYVPEPRTRLERLQFLDTQIEIPRLPDAAALRAILDQRVSGNVVETALTGARSRDAFDDAAVVALMAAYDEGDSLRRVMQVCHEALDQAINAEAEIIGADHVEAARLGM